MNHTSLDMITAVAPCTLVVINSMYECPTYPLTRPARALLRQHTVGPAGVRGSDSPRSWSRNCRFILPKATWEGEVTLSYLSVWMTLKRRTVVASIAVSEAAELASRRCSTYVVSSVLRERMKTRLCIRVILLRTNGSSELEPLTTGNGERIAQPTSSAVWLRVRAFPLSILKQNTSLSRP